MIFSVSTWSAHPLLFSGAMTKEDFVTFIHSYGAKGMEVVDIDFEDTSYENMKELREIGRAHDVEITCMSLEHDLCLPDANHRRADVLKVTRWMDLSRRLGVDKVRVFTGWKKDGIPYDTQMEWVYEGLHAIARQAEAMDITLVLENHNTVCLEAGEILNMLERIHSPQLFTCPDVFNYKKFTDAGAPVIDDEAFAEIERLLPLAKNAHIKICEAVAGNTQDRYLDIKRMLDRLKAFDYNGPVALEFMWPYLEKGRDVKDALAGALQVMNYQLNNRMK